MSRWVSCQNQDRRNWVKTNPDPVLTVPASTFDGSPSVSWSMDLILSFVAEVERHHMPIWTVARLRGTRWGNYTPIRPQNCTRDHEKPLRFFPEARGILFQSPFSMDLGLYIIAYQFKQLDEDNTWRRYRGGRLGKRKEAETAWLIYAPSPSDGPTSYLAIRQFQTINRKTKS